MDKIAKNLGGRFQVRDKAPLLLLSSIAAYILSSLHTSQRASAYGSLAFDDEFETSRTAFHDLTKELKRLVKGIKKLADSTNGSITHLLSSFVYPNQF